MVSTKSANSQPTELPDYHTPITVITNQKTIPLYVALATTSNERQKGLMGINFLPHHTGMLFCFEKPEHASFWMKNTLISLDLLFIDAQGTIIHIHPRAEPHDLQSMTAPAPVMAVLEVNGGWADKHQIKPGDLIKGPLHSGCRLFKSQRNPI